MDLYAENILDHYRHPRGKGSLKNPSVSHREENVSCGDDLTVELMIEDGKISSIGWDGQGCAISQAAMSILSEELIGKTVEEVSALKPAYVYELLGVPIGPRRFKCALLGVHTLKNALLKANGKPAKNWTQTVAIDGA